MKRVLVLGVLVGVGALSIAVSGQAPPGASQKAIDATKIEKVKDNLYVITGSGVEDTDAFSGGNVAVFITDAGVKHLIGHPSLRIVILSDTGMSADGVASLAMIPNLRELGFHGHAITDADLATLEGHLKGKYGIP